MARACTDSAIRKLEAQVNALENYRDLLEEISNDWINDALDFEATSPITDLADMILDVTDNMTTATLGCEVTDIPQVNDFIQDCKNKIRGELARKIRDILFDTAGLATANLAVLERFLCASLSDLLALFDRYSLNRLLDAIDRDQTCITSSKDAATWAAEIDAQNARIDQVIDDLPIDSSGNFDFDKLTEDLTPALKANMQVYKTQTDSMNSSARQNLADELGALGDLNPASRF